jgi:uncharacterized protein YndB with AHSA1/START domain
MENNQTLEVKVTKQFQSGVSQLYSAWTNEQELKQWWRPLGISLSEVKNDIREGGEVRYIFGQNQLVISGKYLEAQDGKRLVYTWKWELAEDAVRNAEYKLTVTFSGDDTKSEISVLQENFENEETVKPHKDGWEQGLKDLEQYLSGSSSLYNTTAENKGVQAESGYRETPEQAKVAGG